MYAFWKILKPLRVSCDCGQDINQKWLYFNCLHALYKKEYEKFLYKLS